MECCLTILITHVKNNFCWILGNAVYANRNVTPIKSGDAGILFSESVLRVKLFVSLCFAGKHFNKGGKWGSGGGRKRRNFDRPQTKKQSEGNEDETKATHTRFDDDEPTVKKVKTEDDSWYVSPHVYITAFVFSWYCSFNFYIILTWLFFFTVLLLFKPFCWACMFPRERSREKWKCSYL